MQSPLYREHWIHLFQIPYLDFHINNTYNALSVIHLQSHNVISDDRETTYCPLTLMESDLDVGECMTLEVYAEQYGVQSEKKSFTACYDGKVYPNIRPHIRQI